MNVQIKCEKCGRDHDGNYGSGRFCSSGCAKSFSTAHDRKAINAKVAAALAGHSQWGHGFQAGDDPKRKLLSHQDRMRAVEAKARKRAERYAASDWDGLPLAEKYRRVMSDQGGVCLTCGMITWRDRPLVLEIDHINGRHEDNARTNLRYLCPNCHSQTPTYRRGTNFNSWPHTPEGHNTICVTQGHRPALFHAHMA